MDCRMTSSSSEPQPQKYFCSEPWTGLLAIQTNMDVTFCPCFLKMKIGNLKDSTIQEVWNAEPLVQLRRSFSAGELPEACRGQLCPPALGQGMPR
jgi:MoaA/NifB/PqqE/SkfB family radical SAM enzyme